jgi:hypothetical protein
LKAFPKCFSKINYPKNGAWHQWPKAKMDKGTRYKIKLLLKNIRRGGIRIRPRRERSNEAKDRIKEKEEELVE